VFETYTEYGALGVIVLLFIGMIQFLRSTLMGKLNEIEEICIKLIDRWNRSDDVRDRRYEDMIKELNDLSDVVMEIKGQMSRINGK
jgi:hypothetical protein